MRKTTVYLAVTTLDQEILGPNSERKPANTSILSLFMSSYSPIFIRISHSCL